MWPCLCLWLAGSTMSAFPVPCHGVACARLVMRLAQACLWLVVAKLLCHVHVSIQSRCLATDVVGLACHVTPHLLGLHRRVSAVRHTGGSVSLDHVLHWASHLLSLTRSAGLGSEALCYCPAYDGHLADGSTAVDGAPEPGPRAMPPKDANRLVFYLSRAARELRAASSDLEVAMYYAEAFVSVREEPESSESAAEPQSGHAVGVGPVAVAAPPPPALALPPPGPGGAEAPSSSAGPAPEHNERPQARSRSPRRITPGSGLRSRG